jgi:hypothetical protein
MPDRDGYDCDRYDCLCPRPHGSPVKLRLTPFQVREVGVGMDVDRDDGNPEWGSLEYIGKRRDRAAWLIVTNLDRALYRITSSRDIWQDNAAGGDPGYLAGARSLAGLTDRLIAAAGGREAFSPEYRRWI